MRIRITDRILVAVAGLIILCLCAGVVAQVFFGTDVIGFVSRQLSVESSTGKALIGIAAGILLILGLYCLLMLFRHRKRKDKFIVQKLESGDLAISLKTLETMVQKCLDQHQEIKPDSIRLENQRDGLLIRIRGNVAGGISIPLTVDTLQKQVKQYVTACSGVEVKGIRIQIESSGEDAKDAPFAIEPPVSNLLPKGTEAAEPAAPQPETSSEHEEKKTPAAEENSSARFSGESAAAAAMAAAENMMENLDNDDDRPIHQRLFSAQEEPCIMPLPPEMPFPGAEGAVPEEKTAGPETEKGNDPADGLNPEEEKSIQEDDKSDLNPAEGENSRENPEGADNK